MGLAGLIRSRVSGPPPLDPAKLRRARPVRNPRVEATPGPDGSLLLAAPLKETSGGVAAILARWAKAPATKKFELEPVGAFVWESCDGRQSFEAISARLRSRYKMNRLEADTALTAFLQTLSRRGLLTLMVADDS